MGDVIRYGFIALCILVLISVVVRWIVENWVFLAIGLFLVVLGILAFLKFRKPSRKKPAEITEWSLDLLNKLEWKRFEEVVCEYYMLMGYRSEVTRLGADGGVDPNSACRMSDILRRLRRRVRSRLLVAMFRG